jgi:hypothetical protein
MVKKRDSLLLDLERALRRALVAETAASLRVLQGGQLVIRQDMVANPQAGQGVKTAPEVPSTNGFEIYLSCRAPGPSGETAAPPAGVEQPLEQPAALQWRGQRSIGWRFAIPSGEEIRLRVAAGEHAPQEKINRLLDAISGVLRIF